MVKQVRRGTERGDTRKIVSIIIGLQSAKILLLPPKCEIIMVPSYHPIREKSNIAIAILDFSLLHLVKLSLLILFAAFLVSVLCFFLMALFLKFLCSSNYRDSDSCRSFSLLKPIANAFKSVKEQQLYGNQFRKEAKNQSIAILEKSPFLKGNKNYFAF